MLRQVLPHFAVLAALLIPGSAPVRAQDAALFPFVLPANDHRAGPTDVSGWMETPAGKHGPIVVKDGHLFAGPKRIEQLQEDFLEIWARSGATVLFVTHSIDEALLLADRIFVSGSGPGRIRTIVESPFADERLHGDIRTRPDFANCRAELRQLLRSDRS